MGVRGHERLAAFLAVLFLLCVGFVAARIAWFAGHPVPGLDPRCAQLAMGDGATPTQWTEIDDANGPIVLYGTVDAMRAPALDDQGVAMAIFDGHEQHYLRATAVTGDVAPHRYVSVLAIAPVLASGDNIRVCLVTAGDL